MAVLRGSLSNRRDREQFTNCVEIVPLTPALDAPRNAYRVRIGPNSWGHVFESRVSTDGYPDTHESMRFLAEACSCVQTLVALPAKAVASAPIGFRYSLWWSDFLLTNAGTPRRPDALNVAVYVYDTVEQETGQTCPCDRCTVFDFATNVEAVATFGDALMFELIAAWRKRQELGIGVEGEADDWPGYFEGDPKWSRLF